MLGVPDQTIHPAPRPTKVAVIGADYIELKPRLSVEEGDIVAAGAPILTHKDTPTVMVTAPVSGRVSAINRGYRRVLISVEIEVDESAAAPVDFAHVGDAATGAGITERLCASGLWTSFRTRPYSKVPAPDSVPAAIYINAMDTEPLAGDPEIVIGAEKAAFLKGVETIAALHETPTFLCMKDGADVPGADVAGVEAASFSGPHPAGLSGTHMHFLVPPAADRAVWTIGYQDVIAIGKLMLTGHLHADRVIALAGPLVTAPRLVKTVAGASMLELTTGQIDAETPPRLISGSVLSGRAANDPLDSYLGRYANQMTVIEEDPQQNLLGWIRPMSHKFAFQPVLGSALAKKLFPLTSNLNGGRRAMVPLGTFEDLMPQDFLPTQLLRALLVMDTDTAQALGALELDEEDLSLVGFACPAKYEYGVALRDCLAKIEKDG